DHDVTDDWNLSAKWEATAYGHPFSRRIVGNALAGYALCQGWGNRPEGFAALLEQADAMMDTARDDGMLAARAQDAFVDRLLDFEGWHYVLETTPKLIVLDTRTHRWH